MITLVATLNQTTLEFEINVGIIGSPNTGKSSLLNNLIGEEKAIVTDIEGTTRDVVEGSFILDGIVCHILDTAGIRKTNDVVEQLGVNKSLEIIDKSDLILLVLNNNEKLTEEEQTLLKKIKNKKHIIIINKIDLADVLNIDNQNVVKISIKEKIGLDTLKNKIKEMFNLGEITTKDMTYLSNARSISLLKKSLKIIDEIIENISNNTPIDVIEIDLKNCWSIIGEIIGESYTDELIVPPFIITWELYTVPAELLALPPPPPPNTEPGSTKPKAVAPVPPITAVPPT